MCPMCHVEPSFTYTEAYRAECEAQYVADLKNNLVRNAYVDMVAVKRGRPSADQLRAAVRALIPVRT